MITPITLARLQMKSPPSRGQAKIQRAGQTSLILAAHGLAVKQGCLPLRYGSRVLCKAIGLIVH